jgi:hypothetical protein
MIQKMDYSQNNRLSPVVASFNGSCLACLRVLRQTMPHRAGPVASARWMFFAFVLDGFVE